MIWSARMGAALALSLALLAAEPNHVVNLSERVPFAFILNTPTGAVANARSSEVIRQVSDLLRRDTSFALQEIEAAVVENCRGQLTCVVRTVRRDYEPTSLVAPDGRPIPYREHVRRMREEGRTYPRYILLLSNVTVPDRPDRLSALLLDTDAALGVFHAAPKNTATWKDDVEAQIATDAVRGEQIRKEIRDALEARLFLEQLFLKTYAGVFEESGHWQPYGSIDIESPEKDLEIVIDGTSVGTTQAGITRVAKVLPGTRGLVLRHPEFKQFDTTVVVKKGEEVLVDAALSRVSGGYGIARSIVFWGGVTSAIAGVAVSALAFSRADSNVRTVCFGDAVCEGNRFVTSGYNPDAPLLMPDQVNDGGILMAPLGMALLGAGAGFSLGVLLTDDDSPPWWALIAGVVAGGAVYSVGALAN